MSYLLAFGVWLHGLIHLLGFAKAFGLAELPQVNQDIGKAMGLVWLGAALLFVALAFVIVMHKSWWWLPAIPALILSQTAIVFAWDAKFGTAVNLIILFATVLAFGSWHFQSRIQKEKEQILSQIDSQGKRLVTAQSLETLPEPVQRWLRFSGVLGQERIHSVFLKQKGEMRLKPDQEKWSQVRASQIFTTDKPGFLWWVEMDMMPLVPVVGRDRFFQGAGQMIIKIASVIPVVQSRESDKVNEATLQRYLAEIVWFPTAALSRYIHWEARDDNSAKAMMAYGGTTGSVVFHFHKDGSVERVVAQRYKEPTDESPTEWIATIQKTNRVNGLNIPTKLEVTWQLESGPFTWYRFEIFDILYKGSAIY